MKIIIKILLLQVLPILLCAQVEEEITFESDGLTLNGTLSLPDEEGPFPVLLLLHGSGPNDRNQTITLNDGNSLCLYPELFGETITNFKDISDYLVQHGIAVLRYDKRSFTYPNSLNPITITPYDFIEDASRAIDFLLERDDIDPSCIVLGGHSQGSTLIPVLGINRNDIRGLVSLAGPVSPIDSLLAEQLRAIYTDCANDPITGNTVANLIYDEFALLRAGEIPNNEPVSIEIPGNPSQVLNFGFPTFYKDWIDLGDSVISNYDISDLPLLFLQGDADFNVPVDNAVRFENNLSSDSTEVIIFEDVNHFLTPNNDSKVSDVLLDTLVNWILGLKITTHVYENIIDHQKDIALKIQSNSLNVKILNGFSDNMDVIIFNIKGEVFKRQKLQNPETNISLDSFEYDHCFISIIKNSSLVFTKKFYFE